MRARGLVFVGLFALPAAAVVACNVDILHSTDFPTLCDDDPTAPACLGEAGATDSGGGHDGTIPRPDGESPEDSGSVGDTGTDGRVTTDGGDAGAVDFCSWTPTKSHATARRACAWLGACAGAYGVNEFGVCVDDAIQVYDCRVKPQHRAAGRVRDYWACLAQVTSCADVQKCITGGAAPSCDAGVSSAQNAQCHNGIGMACAPEGGAPIAYSGCQGAESRDCAVVMGGMFYQCAGQSGCSGVSCVGTRLVDCNATNDRGIDCAGYGGTCAEAGAGYACTANSDGGSCTADGVVQCMANLAQGCITGTFEQVDCAALLEDTGICQAGTGYPWDLASYCKSTAGGPCSPGCNADGGLRACQRGLNVLDIACGDYGLKPCQVVPVLSTNSYRCAAP